MCPGLARQFEDDAGEQQRTRILPAWNAGARDGSLRLPPRPQRNAFTIDTDPVIGETERRARGNLGHMTSDAIRFRFRVCRRVATLALSVVGRGYLLERRVRVVARQARELASGPLEAFALSQVNGLVADVPRLGPIHRDPRRRGHAVATAAEIVDAGGAHRRGIANRLARGCVRLARSMTGLTAHARFRRLHVELRAKRQASCRMAGEAPENSWFGIEGGVPDTRRAAMSGSEIELAGRRKQAEAMLEIRVFIQLRDVRDGLGTRSKSPADTVSTQCRGVASR